MNNENRLITYLFGESKIITGNDNSEIFDDYMKSHDFSEYDVYYKGNQEDSDEKKNQKRRI